MEKSTIILMLFMHFTLANAMEIKSYETLQELPDSKVIKNCDTEVSLYYRKAKNRAAWGLAVSVFFAPITFGGTLVEAIDLSLLLSDRKQIYALLRAAIVYTSNKGDEHYHNRRYVKAETHLINYYNEVVSRYPEKEITFDELVLTINNYLNMRIDTHGRWKHQSGKKDLNDLTIYLFGTGSKRFKEELKRQKNVARQQLVI